MNLISCDGCGAVFDKSKLKFPDDIWDKEEGYDMSKCEYFGEFRIFVPKVSCPVCGGSILEPGYDY